MERYLSELQEKYEYKDELVELLGKIIPAFIQHFGKENEQLILDAISSCKIHIQDEKEKAEEYVSRYFPYKKIDKIPVTAGAFYDSMPIINGEEIISKRLIYLRSNKEINFQDEKTISILVHELGHLIKSFNNEFSIVNGEILQRSGLAITAVNVDEETGKQISGEEKNTGIEEAINCYDEEKVMSIILGREFFDVQYGYHFNECINHLFENEELRIAFMNAQIHGKDDYIKIILKDDFEKLSECCEKIYHPFFATFSELKNGGIEILKQKREEAKSEIIDFANKYRTNKEKNFSIKAVEELDRTVTFSERESGMKVLKENIKEIKEKKQIMEGKKDDPRI